MAYFSDEEKADYLEYAKSEALKRDFEYVKENRINPFVANGQVDFDKVVYFLTEFNKMFNHQRKPFKKITGDNWRI